MSERIVSPRLRKVAMTVSAGCLALFLALSAPIQAAAGTTYGTRGCPNYGWLKATTSGAAVFRPPGSDREFQFVTGGTRALVAVHWNLDSKTGGGPWRLDWAAGTTATGISAYCSSMG